MNWIIIAQFFGLLSFIFNFTSTQQAEKNKILLHNGLANLLSGIQYLCLGAYSGCVATLIATTRNVVFGKLKEKVPLYVLIIYLIVAITFNIKTIHTFLDIIPVLNICTYGIAICQKDVGILKKTIIINSTLGLVYDLTNYAFIGALSQILGIIGGVVGYIRYKNLKKAFV